MSIFQNQKESLFLDLTISYKTLVSVGEGAITDTPNCSETIWQLLIQMSRLLLGNETNQVSNPLRR